MGSLHDSLILRADMVTNKNWFTTFSSVLLLPFVLDFKSWKAPANTVLCVWTFPFVMTQKLNSQPGLTIQLNGLLTNKNNYMFTYNECENCNCFSYGISVPFCKFCFFLFLFCLFFSTVIDLTLSAKAKQLKWWWVCFLQCPNDLSPYCICNRALVSWFWRC